MITLHRLKIRLNELQGNEKWPTQIDVVEIVFREIFQIMTNIKDTSLNLDDELARMKVLAKKFLSTEDFF